MIVLAKRGELHGLSNIPSASRLAPGDAVSLSYRTGRFVWTTDPCDPRENGLSGKAAYDCVVGQEARVYIPDLETVRFVMKRSAHDAIFQAVTIAGRYTYRTGIYALDPRRDQDVIETLTQKVMEAWTGGFGLGVEFLTSIVTPALGGEFAIDGVGFRTRQRTFFVNFELLPQGAMIRFIARKIGPHPFDGLSGGPW